MTNASATADPGGQIRSLSFLSPGNFPDNRPEEGLEDTLRLFELGEQLGFAAVQVGDVGNVPTGHHEDVDRCHG